METQAPIGFFAQVQRYIDSLFGSLHITARDVITYVTCFGIGFFIGIIFKRYGKWMIAFILGAIAIITLLHYFELISVHQEKIRFLLGLQDEHMFEGICVLVQEKFVTRWLEIVLVLIGAVVGFKLG